MRRGKNRVVFVVSDLVFRTRRNACDNYRYKLLVGDLHLYYIGRHCEYRDASKIRDDYSSGKCRGIAAVVVVARKSNGDAKTLRSCDGAADNDNIIAVTRKCKTY